MAKIEVVPLSGWILIGRSENHRTGSKHKSGPFYIAREEVFSRKSQAVRFMKKYNWGPGYMAVRGSLSAADCGDK